MCSMQTASRADSRISNISRAISMHRLWHYVILEFPCLCQVMLLPCFQTKPIYWFMHWASPVQAEVPFWPGLAAAKQTDVLQNSNHCQQPSRGLVLMWPRIWYVIKDTKSNWKKIFSVSTCRYPSPLHLNNSLFQSLEWAPESEKWEKIPILTRHNETRW